VPENVPVILESRFDQDGIDDEIENARRALSGEDVLALTGDEPGSLALKQDQASPDALGHRLRAAGGAQLPEN
jgi:hypothetical protein